MLDFPKIRLFIGGGDLVLLDPDVLGLAGDLAEARVLDQQPLRLGWSECDARVPLRGEARELASC